MGVFLGGVKCLVIRTTVAPVTVTYSVWGCILVSVCLHGDGI